MVQFNFLGLFNENCHFFNHRSTIETANAMCTCDKNKRKNEKKKQSSNPQPKNSTTQKRTKKKMKTFSNYIWQNVILHESRSSISVLSFIFIQLPPAQQQQNKINFWGEQWMKIEKWLLAAFQLSLIHELVCGLVVVVKNFLVACVSKCHEIFAPS